MRNQPLCLNNEIIIIMMLMQLIEDQEKETNSCFGFEFCEGELMNRLIDF